MTLPAVPASGSILSRPRAALPKRNRDVRLAALTATLGLFGWRADTAPTSLGLIVSRTADLTDEDFAAALDWLADHAETIGNPIPALRRAAAEHAKGRRERADAERSTPRPHEGPAVPCPPEIRERLRRIGVVRDVPEPDPRAQRLRGLRQLATVLGATNGTDARAEAGRAASSDSPLTRGQGDGDA